MSIRSRGFLAALWCLLPAMNPPLTLGLSADEWVTYSDYRFVAALATDSRSVYAATANGLVRFDLLANSFERAFPIPKPVNVLGIDPFTGDVWGAGAGKIHRFDTALDSWSSSDVPVGEAVSVGFDPDSLWVEGRGGCRKMLRPIEVWTPTSCASLPAGGVKWAGARSGDTLGNPDYAFLSPFSVRDASLQTYEISAVAREPVLANLWVGTRGNGLFRFNLLTRQGVSLPFGLAEANVMAVSRDGDSYWFGGVSRSANRNAGITRWTRSTGTWSHSYPSLADGLGDADVTCIESDRREIWFGTGRGIACYDKTRNSWKTLPIPGSPGINRITSLLSTGDTLWIGTSAGLKRLLKSANVIEAVTEPNVDRLGINCLLGLDSTVWVATDRGLYLLSRGRRGSSILSEQTGALDGRVLAVDSDGDGLWCLTPRGLVVYRPAPNEFARFLLPHYLPPSGGFTCLAVGGPYVWIGSAAGAIRFDKKMKRWKVYSVREGLADGLVQDVFLDGDYVWFGTPRGVTSFHWNSPAGLSP